MIKNKEFLEIKNTLILWLEVNKKYWASKGIVTNEVSNSEDSYVLDFTSEKWLARLIIDEPDFAPYRFVSFEKGYIDSEKIIYWYDDEKCDAEKIKNELVNLIYKH